MTAHPDPTDFENLPMPRRDRVVLRPKLIEHYWGYDVRMNEHMVGFAVCLRVACGLLTIVSLLAAVGVWFLPTLSVAGSAVTSKSVVSLVLVCLAVMVGRTASRGTRVRVQIDTANGEVREVVDGPFDSVITLSSYGMDAVDAVEIEASKNDASFGQIQIKIANAGWIAIADGAIATLPALRDRLVRDCQIGDGQPVPPAEWSGPLAA